MEINNLEKFNELIKNSESLLQDASSVRTIGNRPHFPMMLMMNEGVGQNSWEIVKKRLVRLWTQTAHHLVAGSYSILNGYLKIEELHNTPYDQEGKPLNDIVTKEVNNTLKNPSVFVDVSKWLLFNIIDTVNMENINDFEACFDALPCISDLLGNPFSSMAIVVLRDEKAVGNDLAQDIRHSLAEKMYSDGDPLYDSVVVISDRTRGNTICEIDELYSVLSDILIMANNDAVTESDDGDFLQRMHLMFGKRILGVAYIKKEKPNRRITLQIYDEIIKRVKVESNTISSQKDKLTDVITRAVNNIHSEKLASRLLPDDLEIMIESLPLKRIPEGRVIDLPYDIYSREYEVDSSILASVADNILSTINENGINSDVEEHVRTEAMDFDISSWSMISEGDIEEVLENIGSQQASHYSSVIDYYKQKLISEIEKRHIRPNKKQALIKISHEARNRRKEINDVIETYNMVKPPEGYSELGGLYVDAIEKYLNSETGENSLNQMWSLSGEEENIYFLLERVFKSVVDDNPSGVFSLTFIDEWSKRLRKSGDMIYRQISNELIGEVRDRIFLFGNYTINEVLKVYMMHTTDANDQNPTELFRHLRTTFNDDKRVQYINTGYDDSLEAITLIELSKLDIELN